MLIAWSIQNAMRWVEKGIRVNVVSPGPVETPILEDFVRSFGNKAEQNNQSSGGAGTAADIASTIVYLSHESSRWINGQNIASDGGLHSQLMCKMLSL
jgi:NAD(P)-dependent dehydrogenase (short-subunit alcohol dehydrogenase family)